MTCCEYHAGLKLRVRIEKLFFLFLNQTICYGYSTEPSQLDGSFEHPKHMLKLMVKKYFHFYAQKNCLSKPMVWYDYLHIVYQDSKIPTGDR